MADEAEADPEHETQTWTALISRPTGPKMGRNTVFHNTVRNPSGAVTPQQFRELSREKQ